MIQGDLVRLRPIQRDDIAAMRTWFDSPEIMKHWGRSQPVVLESQFETDLSGRFARFDDAGYFAIVPRTPADASIIGRVEWEGLDRLNRSAEVMILIGDPAFWGHGYGTDALVCLLRYLFATKNLYRVSLSVLSWNARAVRSYEKAGFTVEGRVRDDVYDAGRYHDQTLMAILRPEFDARWPSLASPG